MSPGHVPSGCAASSGSRARSARPSRPRSPTPAGTTTWTTRRSGEELAWALDSTWKVIQDCLDRWPADELHHVAQDPRPGGRAHSRASILNRMLSHDAFHAGEYSQLLGRHGLPAIDLWNSAAPERPRRRPTGQATGGAERGSELEWNVARATVDEEPGSVPGWHTRCSTMPTASARPQDAASRRR